MASSSPIQSPPDEPPWTPLGRHRQRIIGSQLQLQTFGEMTPEDAVGLMEQLIAMRKLWPDFTLLIDVGGGISASAATRRTFVQQSDPKHPSVPTAVVGTGVVARTLFRLTLNAIRMLNKREVELEFFTTVKEAQAWLRQLIAKRG